MKKFIEIFLIILIINKIKNNCNFGCLKCKENNQCLLCNANKNYFLSGFTCELKIIENCEFQNNFGKCLKCVTDYYLDSLTKKCLKVPDTNLIANCLSYTENGNCSFCKNGFYISDSICEAIPIAIENCLVYQDDDFSICLECIPGYMLDYESKNCVKIISISNCATYSILNCQECKNGYLKNSNYYLEYIMEDNRE